MRIVFMTPDEPLYLPDFYRFVFDNLRGEHEIRVIVVPPLYKKTTTMGLALRYAKTFGYGEAAALAFQVLSYKGMDLFSGRGGAKFYSLKSVLAHYGIPATLVHDVNSPDTLALLREWGTELIISISCPQIFKQALIQVPPKGCLNLHGSLLPDYRGVMPSFWVLANGEQEAGSTLFFVNEKIDGGDVLIQKHFPILADDTLDSFIRKSKRIGAEMVLEAIKKIRDGQTETRQLDMTKGSYYGWPDKEAVKRFRSSGRRFR
jgi:methionyl-tRNA formyltransferase